MKKMFINTIFILSVSINIAVFSILGWNFYKRKTKRWQEPYFTWQTKPLHEVLRDDMGLKEKEIVELRRMIDRRKNEILQKRQRIHILRKGLRSILAEPEPNRKELVKVVESLNDEQNKLNFLIIDRLLEIKDTLPHEVQKRWRRLLQQELFNEKRPRNKGGKRPGF